MKTCSVCKITKKLPDFNVANGNLDGHRNECKVCRRDNDRIRRKRRTPRQLAHRRYMEIAYRCSYRSNYTHIENRLDEVEFIDWYLERHFDGCEVDRVDNNGHYQLDNIQLLSKVDHNIKRSTDRISLDSGTAVCLCCGRVYPYSVDNFHTRSRLISKHNPLGIRSTCKGCCNNPKGEVSNAL